MFAIHAFSILGAILYSPVSSAPYLANGNTAIQARAYEPATSGSTEGTEGYGYDRLPKGITKFYNGQSVGFLTNTTGAPTIMAPQPGDEVPEDAAIYSATDPLMDMKAFRLWHDDIKDRNAGGTKKWMKIQPGIYEFQKGSGFPYDWNNNIEFNGYVGWTFDIRGVVFLETRRQGEDGYSDQMLYINNCEDFTILGGTFWLDQGEEMFSQGKVLSMTDADPSVTVVEVDEGYDLGIWTAGLDAGSYNSINAQNPEHFYHPDSNFWYQSDVKALDGRQIQALYSPTRSGIKTGNYITIKRAPSSAASASMECNSNIHFRGMTSNAVYFNYGIGGPCNKSPLVIEDCLITHLPALKGYTARVYGPTMSYGNYGSAIFEAEGMLPITFINSYWQYTGNPNDLTSMEKYYPPKEFGTPEY